MHPWSLGLALLAPSLGLARKRANAMRCSKTLPAFLSMARTLHSTAHPPSFMNLCAACLNRHKNAQPWKGVLPEEQSVRARMARPIRMDAGILCDRAEPPFTSHILTATPPRRTFSSPLPKQKAARRRLNSHPTGQVAIRFTGAFFCRSHITVSRRCSAIKANSKMPMAILVHQELSVPSKLIQV